MTRRTFVGTGLGLLALAGCQARGASTGDAPVSSGTDADAGADGTGATGTTGMDDAVASANAGAAAKVLVACFSWSGNTWGLAQSIADQTGADLVRMEPAEAYTTNYDEVLDVAQREKVSDARPALASVPDVSGYGTVYLGFPIWWYTTPMIVRTYLDACDLSGKVVMPFCTSGGSSIDGALSDLRGLYPSVSFSDGLTVTTSQLDKGASLAADWIGA